MNRLTHERVNGIKTGYWSAAKKDDLIQRLAEYENTGLDPEEIMDGKMLTGWAPCCEGLPTKYRDKSGELIPFLVCVDSTDYPFRAFYDGKHWGDGWSKLDVIAWMPLPEPYEGGATDEHDK